MASLTVTAANPHHVKWMKEALKVAKSALGSLKEVPVGCVIVYQQEKHEKHEEQEQIIIGRGHNRTNLLKNPTRHAEFEAIDEAMQFFKDRHLDWSREFPNRCTLYVTCEPCIMCASALRQVRLLNCVYGCANDRFGGCESVLDVATNSDENDDEDNHQPKLNITKGVCEQEAIKLFQSFYSFENPAAPVPKNKANRIAPCLDGIID